MVRLSVVLQGLGGYWASLLLHDFDIDLLHVNLLVKLCRKLRRLKQFGIYTRCHGKQEARYSAVDSMKEVMNYRTAETFSVQCRAIKVLPVRHGNVYDCDFRGIIRSRYCGIVE